MHMQNSVFSYSLILKCKYQFHGAFQNKIQSEKGICSSTKFQRKVKMRQTLLETYGSIVTSYPTNQKFSQDVIVHPL